MNISKKCIEVELKATNKTHISSWTGSMLRGAIKNAVAYENCKSLKFGQCSKCLHEDCLNKKLFDRKHMKSGRIEANTITLESNQYDDKPTDTIKTTISLYGDTSDYIDGLRSVLVNGFYMGEPRVKWHAVSFNERDEEIEIPEIGKPSHDKVTECTIELKTPLVSKHITTNIKPDKFMMISTIRICGIVNMLGINYEVPFRKLIEAASKLKVQDCNLRETVVTRKSSTKNRMDNIKSTIGSFKLVGDMTEIYDFLELASKLSIGKEATMGFGRFTVKRG